jgi:uncharacterized protein YqeY
MTGLRERLRLSLRAAMRAKDGVAVSALRSALAALDNAEAVPVVVSGAPTTATQAQVVGTITGVGAAEAARRTLTVDEERAVVQAEVGDRFSAASEFDALGRRDQAERLRLEAAVLARSLSV